MAQPPTAGEMANAQGGSAGLMSSLYFAAGAASGLVEGYVLLARTVASELLGLVHGSELPGKEGTALSDSQRMVLQRIVSVPRGMSAQDLAAELANDPEVQAALGSPAAGDIQVEFLDANGEVLTDNELHEVTFAFTNTNGHAPSYDSGADSGTERAARRALPRSARGVVLRTAWWAAQEEELWETAGVGPIRHRRPATARLTLSKYLMRNPCK